MDEAAVDPASSPDGPAVTGELVGVDHLTDRERVLTLQHAQLRDLLTRFTILWRGTARRCRDTGRQSNIAAGVAYDIAADSPDHG